MTFPHIPIVAVRNEEQARRCFPVFRELRPHLDELTFLARWREQAASGYEIVAIEADGVVAAAAGFRECTWTPDTRATTRTEAICGTGST